MSLLEGSTKDSHIVACCVRLRSGRVVVGGVNLRLTHCVDRFFPSKMHRRAPHRALNYFQAMAAAVTLVDVLYLCYEAHTLIAECFGPEHELDGLLYPDLYVFRRASRDIFQLSYYDTHWISSWRNLCFCRGGRRKAGCACVATWRKQGWICPLVLQYL